MKSRYILLIGICCMMILTGCSSPKTGTEKASDTPDTPTKGRLFCVSFQTMNNPFFIELNDGLKQVIEAHGDTLVTLDARFDSLKQKNDISDLILKNVSAIFLNPVNWEGVTGSLVQAKQKNIPVVVVDAPVKDADLVLCQVASDNVEAGRMAARALAAAQPESKVVILHQSVNKACIDRVDGFREEAAKHPGITILDTLEGKGTIETALPVMRDVLARFPECNAVFPINDPSALGCISAIESAGKLGQVLVVTVDGSAEAVEAIKAGKLLSSSAQFPREIGRISAEKVYEHLEGKPVDKEVKIPVELITKDNVDAFAAGKEKAAAK